MWKHRPSADRPKVAPPKKKWEPTKNPNATVQPGTMRSDREEIPEGFTKADADKAEQLEARLAAGGTDGTTRAMVAASCQVYWPAPYEVCGRIRDKYNSLGGPNSFLLFPKTNELTNPDGVGKRTEFQNGPIYWSPQGDAHPVVNHFLAAWARHGYENSYIGYPTTDEIVNPDGIGRRQHFTGSTIYWRLNEAYSVGGAIADRWYQLGAERTDSLLGYPITDERVLPDGVGRMNRFERGVIYWHPATGAQAISNHFAEAWGRSGWEVGPLGYPTAGETRLTDSRARKQQFQNGIMVSSPEGNAVPMWGEILKKWTEMGEDRSYLRYPLGPEVATKDSVGRYMTFESGTIYWHPSAGAHATGWPLYTKWALEGLESGRLGYPTRDMEYNSATKVVTQVYQRGSLEAPAIHLFDEQSRLPSITDGPLQAGVRSAIPYAADEYYCQMWTEEVHASHHRDSKELNVRGGTDCQGHIMREIRHKSFRIYEDRWWGGDEIGRHTDAKGNEGNFNFGQSSLSINASAPVCNNGMTVWATLRGSVVDSEGRSEEGKFDSFSKHGVQTINDCA